MAKKEFSFYGKSEAELMEMSMKEFAALLPAAQRRSLARGLSHRQQQLLKKVEANNGHSYCENLKQESINQLAVDKLTRN